MKNYKITSIQLIKYQQVLDKVYGKGKFIAGCIMLLFALSFFTSCVSEAKIPLPVGSQERTPQDMQRRPNPPVAITITDTTQQNIFDENPLIKTNHPIVFDAYFAQERDGAYHRIDKSCIGNTVFVVVDTLNLAGEQIDIRIYDGNSIITNNIPFQQYVNTNADSTTQEVFQNTSIDQNGIFSGIVRNFTREDDEIDQRNAIFKLELKATDEATTEQWISDIRRHNDRKLKLSIKVTVPNMESGEVIFCGSNFDSEEERRNDSETNNIWLNQEGAWFEVRQSVTIVLDPGHGHTKGYTGTSIRKYTHAVKDETNAEQLKTDEDGNKIIETSTITTIPNYVYSDENSCKKWKVELGDADPDWSTWNERELVFDVATLMKDELEEYGFDIHLTRTYVVKEGIDDRANLYARNAFSNSKNANYFISIHVNGNPGGSAVYKRGAFYMYRNNDDEATIDRCKELGQYLVKYLKSYNEDNNDFIPVITDDNTQKSDLAVLSSDSKVGNHAKYKSLVEVGTFTHPLDARILSNKQITKTISSQMTKGLLEHIRKFF